MGRTGGPGGARCLEVVDKRRKRGTTRVGLEDVRVHAGGVSHSPSVNASQMTPFSVQRAVWEWVPCMLERGSSSPRFPSCQAPVFYISCKNGIHAINFTEQETKTGN